MAAGKRPSRSARGAQAYNGAVREQLADLQRARILAAMFEVSRERGAGNVSVAHVVERAGVSRRTFYEQFADREDCLQAAFEQALSYASQRVIPAYEAEKSWRERIRAGLLALLRFLDEEPVMARMLIAESLAGGPRTVERRREVLARLTAVVDQGRGESKSDTLSPLAAEGAVGGVLAVIQARLAPSGPGETSRSRTQGAWRATHASDRGRRDAPSLVALTNQLMGMIVLPYLGAPAARRELERPTPKPSSEAVERTILGDPFKEAGMRLTYRTVRVLMAIAEHPGASNRQIADTAEIKDQGQISKLLGRLERVGMVTNTSPGPGQGAPNAWTLTDRGRQVTDSIRAHTEGSRSTPKGTGRGARER